MTDVTKLMEIKAEIASVASEIVKLNEKLHTLRQELEETCTHPTTATERIYHEGGYDYVSEVIIVKTCTICNKAVSSEPDPSHVGRHA